MIKKNLILIPAAGRGSRLNSKKPKIMNLIGKKRIIDILISKIPAFAIKDSKIVFIVNPKFKFQINKYLSLKYKNKVDFKIIIQKKPDGMAIAVMNSISLWNKFNKILIIWGDQVGVSELTIKKILKRKIKKSTFLLPLVKKKNSYVEYKFFRKKLIKINESREGDKCSKLSYSDVGVFLFSSYKLAYYFRMFIKKNLRGKVTNEVNFLPFLLFLSTKNWILKKIFVKNIIESKGINTKKDILFFKKYGKI